MGESVSSVPTVKAALGSSGENKPAIGDKNAFNLNPEDLGKILAGMDPVGDRKLTLAKIEAYFNQEHAAMPLDLCQKLYEAKKDTDVGTIIAMEAVKYKSSLKDQFDYTVAAFAQYKKSLLENRTNTNKTTSI